MFSRSQMPVSSTSASSSSPSSILGSLVDEGGQASGIMADSIVALEEPRQGQLQGTPVIEDTKHTRDGTIDWKGKPAARGKSGGWIVGILVLVNQMLATLAFNGVGLNLVIFMTRVLQQDNATAANNVSTWNGTSYLFALVGAFLADSYWGRYKACTIFQVISVAGLLELSLSSSFLLLKGGVPEDGQAPSKVGILIFYLSIYQIGLGNGAYNPSVTTLGADQFDEEHPVEKSSKGSFFSYFYVANNMGSLVANAALIYLEDKGKWILSYWLSAGAGLLALLLFLSGTRRYRHFKPGGNPLARVCQVIVAAFKKRKLSMPANAENLYEIEGKTASNGGRKILHTPDFKFLDRAAAITAENISPQDNQPPPSPWNLCTITQVEEVKCIIRLLPIWLCSIIYSVVYNQMNSVFVEQAAAMKTNIGSFDIPAASMGIFEIIGVTVMVIIDQLYLADLLPRIFKGKNKASTDLYRMGIGLVLAAVLMIIAGTVEAQRIRHALPDCDGCKYQSSLTVFWQVPQYLIMGASEVFMYVAQLDFFNAQAPDGLKSFASALSTASMAVGSYLSSLLVTVVMSFTTKGGNDGWVSEQLNLGHLDRFYFLIAGLVAVDLAVFVVCAKCYRYIALDGGSETEQENEPKLEIEL